MNDQSQQDAKGSIVNTPAIGFSLEHRLDDHRTIVLQGAIPSDCSDEEFNALLDKLSRASDRQKAKTHLPTIKKLLGIKEEALKAEYGALLLAQTEHSEQQKVWRRQLEESGRRNTAGALRLTPDQKQAHIKVQAQVAQSEQNIKILEKEIAEYRRQLADATEKLEA